MKVGNIEVYGVIYKITNTINGKCYIGQTIQGFDERYANNLYRTTHNEHLKRSIEKYGIENFDVCKIYDVAFSKEELDIKEVMYIKLFDSTNPQRGYNKSTGGTNSTPTKETIEKISKSLMGHEVSEETKRKQSEKAKLRVGESNPFYGKRHTEEAKEKNRLSHLGMKHTDEAKEKMSKSRKGRKSPMEDKTHSEETKKKIGEASKGRVKSEETKKKISESNKKTIICITTGRIFDSLKEASKYYNCNMGTISDCCKGFRMRGNKKENVKSAGKFNGQKLVWRYITIIEL